MKNTKEYIETVHWVLNTFSIENNKPKILFQISVEECGIEWNDEKQINECGEIFDEIYKEKTLRFSSL